MPGSLQFTDPKDDDVAVDITEVYVSGATKKEPAAISVFSDDAWDIGDTFRVVLNLDSDKAPEVAIGGAFASEYSVILMKSWNKTGKDISDKGCAQLKISGTYAEVSFSPNCFLDKKVKKFSSNVTTSGLGGEGSDYAPGVRKFSKAVDANF